MTGDIIHVRQEQTPNVYDTSIFCIQKVILIPQNLPYRSQFGVANVMDLKKIKVDYNQYFLIDSHS